MYILATCFVSYTHKFVIVGHLSDSDTVACCTGHSFLF